MLLNSTKNFKSSAIWSTIPKPKRFKKKRYNHNLLKTKFTIVIYSDKGTKQAGEVYLNVAEFLNSQAKSKEKNIQNNRFKGC